MATCAIVGASPEFNAEDFRARHEAGMFEFVIAVDEMCIRDRCSRSGRTRPWWT